MNPVLSVPIALSCHEVERRLRARLAEHGYRVQPSFDLDRACAAEDDPAGVCPHHGTARCTCRLVTLLVYRGPRLVGVLVLHGHDQHARVRWSPVAAEARAMGDLLRRWLRGWQALTTR